MASRSRQRVRSSSLERLIAAPLQFGRDWLVRFVELQGFDRAVALAGQAFTALIPLLIVYTAVVSKATGRDFADQLTHALHLSGGAAAALQAAFAPAGTVENSVSGLGVALLVLSALSFTRALQRLYQFAWGQPSLGLAAAKWGMGWLAFVVLLLTFRPALLADTGGVLRLVLSLALAAFGWLVTPVVLLARRVAWRRLVPMALLTAVGMSALSAASAIWMPHTVAQSAAQFGVIGVAFALLSWLVGAGVVLVVAASGGVVIQERLETRRAGRARAQAAAARAAPAADHPDG